MAIGALCQRRHDKTLYEKKQLRNAWRRLLTAEKVTFKKGTPSSPATGPTQSYVGAINETTLGTVLSVFFLFYFSTKLWHTKL